MPLNILDLESSRLKGDKTANNRLAEIEARWNQPMTEAKVADLWRGIKSDPDQARFYQENFPDAYREMEERYGEG